MEREMVPFQYQKVYLNQLAILLIQPPLMNCIALRLLIGREVTSLACPKVNSPRYRVEFSVL